MFVGRKTELNELEKMYSKTTFQLAVLYGRRRVGKTKIIQKFTENKKTIFFTAIESTSKNNLELLSKAIFRITMPNMSSLPAFASFDEAFTHIYEFAKKEKVVLVIDEYPYLANSERSISSLLQSHIDRYYASTNLFIILCGSSMSFMENQVLGYQSPLYGRRTAQFKIKPFNYYESSLFVKQYTDYEKALVYGVTSGIPKYLELIDDAATFKENTIDLFLKTNSYLFEEPGNLLKQELREPAIYNAIIEAIARGASKLNEVSTQVGLDSGTVSVYFKSLIALGIVKKEVAITDEKNKKKTLYLLADNMFRFWYKFVTSNMYLISSEEGEAVYDDYIKPSINEYMGRIFEDMCMQYLQYRNSSNTLPTKISGIGRWWGTDARKKKEAEIDILAINDAENSAIFCECKFKNEKTGMAVLNELKDKAQLFTGLEKKYYALFSANGFTQELLDYAKENGTLLITLEDMYCRD